MRRNKKTKVTIIRERLESLDVTRSLLIFVSVLFLVKLSIGFIGESKSGRFQFSADPLATDTIRIDLQKSPSPIVGKKNVIEARQSQLSGISQVIETSASGIVFDHSEEDLAWLGLETDFESSADNSSGLRSGLLNPLLLLSPVVSYSGRWNEQEARPWELKLSPILLSMAEKTLNIDLNLETKEVDTHVDLKDLYITPFAFNAFDLGFHSVSADLEQSINVEYAENSDGPRSTLSFFGKVPCGQSGSPKFCNGALMLGSSEAFKLTKLPAKAVFNLWKKGEDPKRETPMVKFVINILQTTENSFGE